MILVNIPSHTPSLKIGRREHKLLFMKRRERSQSFDVGPVKDRPPTRESELERRILHRLCLRLKSCRDEPPRSISQWISRAEFPLTPANATRRLDKTFRICEEDPWVKSPLRCHESLSQQCRRWHPLQLKCGPHGMCTSPHCQSGSETIFAVMERDRSHKPESPGAAGRTEWIFLRLGVWLVPIFREEFHLDLSVQPAEAHCQSQHERGSSNSQ